MRTLLIAVALAACSKSSQPAASAVDLSTPAAAARCQHAAVTAKNADAWKKCFHPDLRADFDRHMAKKPIDWERLAIGVAPLATAKDADFAISMMEPERKAYGDKAASFSLASDQFIAAHLNGKWYVVDSGI